MQCLKRADAPLPPLPPLLPEQASAEGGSLVDGFPLEYTCRVGPKSLMAPSSSDFKDKPPDEAEASLTPDSRNSPLKIQVEDMVEAAPAV